MHEEMGPGFQGLCCSLHPSKSGKGIRNLAVYLCHPYCCCNANPWDNVYYYDINFRELMASKPWRNWGKTYTQGWNMAFNNNPVYMGQHHNNFSNNSQPSHGSKFGEGSNSGKSWKDDCCWRFNKNRCKKQNCDYDHRCTFCAKWNHGHFNCRKRLNKARTGGQSYQSSNNSSYNSSYNQQPNNTTSSSSGNNSTTSAPPKKEN